MTMSNEELVLMLERLSGPGCSIEASTEGVCVPCTHYSLLKQERYVEDWPEQGDRRLWRDCVQLARRRQIASLDSHVREMVHKGTPRVIIEKGQISYALDPMWVGESDEAMEALGFDPARDRVLRDGRGAAIPLVVWDPPAATLVIHAMRSLAKGWNPADQQNRDVNIKGAITLQAQATAPPPRITHDIAPQIASPIIEDAQFEEIEPMPTPPDDPTIDRPGDSPETRALRAKLRENAAEPAPAKPDPLVPPPRNPQPTGRVDLGAPPDRYGDPEEMVTGADIPADGPRPHMSVCHNQP